MANLPEVAQWGAEEDSIYQLELMDFITGGAGGNDNEPHRLLANRTRYLKERQDVLIDDMSKVGGIKNLWIDGAMQIWDDGTSGDISASHQPRYGYGIQIMRSHSVVDINGQTVGTGGSTYHWERVVENGRTWLKMTHVGSVQSGYIGQRWERDTLQFLKGKTVTLSFEYKCGSNMQGTMLFYNEQDVFHDGVGANMGSAVVDYIGDNQVHRASVTVTLSTDNIVPDANAYFGIQLGYGDGGVPDGSVQFSNIQLEINNKATDFEHVPIAIERLRYGRYYQKNPSWLAGQRIANANRVSLHHDFVPNMKSAPMVNITALAQYNNSAVLLPVIDVGGTNQQSLGTYASVNATLVDSAYIYKFVADARIY